MHVDEVVVQLVGDEGKLEIIRPTLEHPFWVEGRGFVEAGYLKAGMYIGRWSPKGDPIDTVGMRSAEIETGRRIKDDIGRDLRPLDSQSDGDFIDSSGKIYDAMGVPAAYANWNGGSSFMSSIDNHLNKVVDHVVIDLTGSNAQQREQVLNYVASHWSPRRDFVKFVGL